MVVEVESPIDFVCAGDVRGRVEEGVFVGFDNDNIGVIEMFGDPIG